MPLCTNCLLLGYCHRIEVTVVSDQEMDSPEYLRGVKATAYEENVGKSSWREHLANIYRDYPGRVIDPFGVEIDLAMEVFDYDDSDPAMTGSWRKEENSTIESWFADFCCKPCAPDVKPRARIEARERVRIVATLLKAKYPVRAATWGIVAANDNKRPSQVD